MGDPEFCHLQPMFQTACDRLPTALMSSGEPNEEDAMGFMDKAKKVAEQAQQKLDEVQEQVQGQMNKDQQGGQGEQPDVRYDEHGRPIQEGPPAGEAPAPSAEPEQPAAEPESEPQAAEPAPKPSEGGTDTNPDPFKPIE
jgi:exonuclease VII small subunit